MASRNPSNKKLAAEEPSLDKRRKIGADKMERQAGRVRTPFSNVSNRSDANAAAADADAATVDFTKEEVEALLTEKKKGNPHDFKKKIENMTDLIKRLRLCVRWFKRIEEGYVQEKEKFQSELEAAEKKCTDTEAGMKSRIDELEETVSDLRKTISSLEERIVKEESEKLEAINSYGKEKEARSESRESSG